MIRSVLRSTAVSAVALSLAMTSACGSGGGGANSGAASTTPIAITVGGPGASGALASGDRQLLGGKLYDAYRFTGQAGQRVVITMTSSALQSQVIVRGPGGTLEQDEASARADPGRIEMILPTSGEYTVLATSVQAGQTGAYQLAVANMAAAPTAIAGPAPRGRHAQRVFLLSVGISDYGGPNNLQYTADDARNMASALRQAGVLSPQSIVLTDAQATVASVRAAFARIAAEADADDVFVFFFSGHGNQTNVRVSSVEPDGKQESIVMRDGEITDTDMAQLFEQVHAGLSIVSLDSCFSGGFARNVVSRPDVMGLFSSEEDLTSAVAANFREGGYLSHFLRLALAGEADMNGDGVVTAGEISTYMHRQFGENVRDVASESQEGQSNYQNLVIDRGGVQVDTPVLHLAADRRPIRDPQGGDGIPAENPYGNDQPQGDQQQGRPEDQYQQQGADQSQYDGQDGGQQQGGDEGGGKP